ncbi:MAG: porphobilinogen synthase [Cellulosilyticaceae bacterium]
MLNRPRRLRSSAAIRNMVRENYLSINDFVYPLFIVEGQNIKEEIPSLPGIYHWSVDRLEEEIKEIIDIGIQSIMLFGIPNKKDEIGTEAYNDTGIVQRAIEQIKKIAPNLYVITDVCMCQYTDHGHCGILTEDGVVHNDMTLEYLTKIAISHAKAGADMVAPSDMMDGRIYAMRKGLDQAGLSHIPIMSYSAKYASNFYGPFRAAAHSAPSFGDRKTYQMDMANSNEAIREMSLDIEEGADIIMIKPALSYLDIIQRAKSSFKVPVAAYNVSGEYAMLKLAVKEGLMNENVIYESLLSIKRAGANLIITYFAKEIAIKIKDGEYESY